MKKFSVYATVTGSKYIGEFEAESKEEAKDKAWESIGCDMVSLCHECSRIIDQPIIAEMIAEEARNKQD